MNELNRTIGGLIKEVEGLRRDLRDDRKTSSDHRAGVRDELRKIVTRTTRLESDMTSLKEKVEGMEQVTVEVTTLRTKAEGAGTLGRWLLTAGGWVLGGASGLGLLALMLAKVDFGYRLSGANKIFRNGVRAVQRDVEFVAP